MKMRLVPSIAVLLLITIMLFPFAFSPILGQKQVLSNITQQQSETGASLIDSAALGAIVAAVLTGPVSLIISLMTLKKTKRIDYEYNVLNRIYQECLPHLFKFIRACEGWPEKFNDIIKHSREGDILKDENDEPARFGDEYPKNYFKVNVFYRMLAPIAAFKILEEQLTSADLNYDRYLATHYELGKMLFYSLSKDKRFAEIIGCRDKYKRSDEQLRQGLRGYEIDKLSEFLILRPPDESPQIKSFVKFTREYEIISRFIKFDPEAKTFQKNKTTKEQLTNKNTGITIAQPDHEEEKNSKEDKQKIMATLDTNISEAEIDFIIEEFVKLNNIFQDFDPSEHRKPILLRILLYHTAICNTIRRIDEGRQRSPTYRHESGANPRELASNKMFGELPNLINIIKKYDEQESTASGIPEKLKINTVKLRVNIEKSIGDIERFLKSSDS